MLFAWTSSQGKRSIAQVLATFPIVRREDEAAFGLYRTKEMILDYMNALKDGDTETVEAV